MHEPLSQPLQTIAVDVQPEPPGADDESLDPIRLLYILRRRVVSLKQEAETTLRVCDLLERRLVSAGRDLTPPSDLGASLGQMI